MKSGVGWCVCVHICKRFRDADQQPLCLEHNWNNFPSSNRKKIIFSGKSPSIFA